MVKFTKESKTGAPLPFVTIRTPIGPPKSTILFRTPGPPTLTVLKVLKPTVYRESFWNQSITKWSDITSPFILNDNIICLIDVFSTNNGYQKN